MSSRFCFCVVRYYGLGWCVCIVFVGLVGVEVFMKSCCFMQLVVLMSILFVSYYELVNVYFQHDAYDKLHVE